MKVKELIELLKKQDPESEVMIQQGEEYDYVVVATVKAKDLTDIDNITDDMITSAVVIEYI